MKRKLVFLFAVAGLALASAKSYSVKLFQPATVGGKELAPGEYKVEVNGEKAVIRNGKTDAEATIKVEDGETKYGTTTVRFTDENGKFHIQEIRLGGTRTKLVFTDAATPRP